jgi:hypothetical protein
MVNNTAHPIYSLPAFDGVNRDINCTKPLYDLAVIQSIASKHDQIYLVTQKCVADVAKLSWDLSDVAQLIARLTLSDYKKSEWCQTNGNSNRPCDSYVCVVSEYNEATNKNLLCEYYIKFSTNTGGQLLLIVSCHF